MGINISRNTELLNNEFLQKFMGRDHIPADKSEFWNSFLQYHIGLPDSSQEQLSLDSRLETLCQSFISHNLQSGNFGSLVTVFLHKVAELLELSDQESSIHVWQTFNALFIIRCLIKYMIETGSEYQLLQHFEAIPVNPSGRTDESSVNFDVLEPKPIVVAVDGSKFEAFFDAIVNLIIVIPVKEFTYHLHLEAVNLVIVLFSLHLFSQQSTDKSLIFKTIYKNNHANALMGSLLHFVSRMVEVPQNMFGISSGSSFVFGIAEVTSFPALAVTISFAFLIPLVFIQFVSKPGLLASVVQTIVLSIVNESLLSIFTFRKSHQDFLSSADLPATFKQHYPLANQSLLLILILTNHCTMKNNAYRTSLFGCSDSQESPKDGATFKIDFSTLHSTLCRIVTIDQATLLLYLLLHRNQRFYKYVMAQQNLQQLVIPILQTLYNAPDSTSHHIYMSLIVLLILSEDDGFNKSVHQIQLSPQILKNIHWYTERSISEISLGGLLVLVVIRTIPYNMLKMRDKYLHTNCLAALANMSGQFRSLHPYVAQRLVSLFETLAKKHARLDQQLKQPVNRTPIVELTDSLMILSDDMLQDLSVVEEVLRMVLEILNSCLSNQLVYCPNLVYTLLYKRQVFETFRSHPAFQDIIQNIDMVVGFFSSRLQRVQDQRGELGVNEVLEVIWKGASQWSSDRLRVSLQVLEQVSDGIAVGNDVFFLIFS